MDRRAFLKTTGGLLAGGLAGCDWGRPILRRVKGGPLKGAVDHVPSVCLQCPAACGILVKRVNGVPIHIRGNPVYPTNRGGLCPKGVAGLQVLYDPDRIKGPLRRAGTRGTDTWRPISWEEAIAEVAERLSRIRKEVGPHSVAFLGGRYQGGMEPLVHRFLRAYGSPNNLGNGSAGSDGTKLALEMTQGIFDYPGFDWERTNYVLSFGASWLEAYRPTAYLLRAYSHLRRGRQGMRAKIVQIDTRFGVTGAKADEWIPIRPGTDAALALSIAHVIVKEGLWDKDFVAEHTFGFEDWEDEAGKHIGFRRHVLEGYAPDRVEKITGIEAARIVRLAREFTSRQPGIAVGERGVSMRSNGVYTRMAVHALNALVGSINRPGGVLVQQAPPLRPLPQVRLDEVAAHGFRQPRIDGAGTRRYPLAREVSQALPDAILHGKPYPLEVLFVYYTNPLYSRTNGRDFQRAFDRIPLLVSFSPFMDDTTRHCDLVLPDHTYLERWQEAPILPSVGYPVVGLRRPVTKPLYDTRHTGDVLLEIGRALGGAVAEALPWKDYHELMTFRLGGIASVEGASVSASSDRAFIEKMGQNGGWWHERDTFLPWESVFRTPSGRFEFFATAIRSRLESLGASGKTDRLLDELGVAARGDEAFLPHYEPARMHGDPERYPLYLNTYKPMAHAEGRGANQPHLQEIHGSHLNIHGDTWLEIHPDTARRYGLEDSGKAWLWSPRGRLLVTVRHHPGALPEVVNMPFGGGHRGYGRWANEHGVNPNDITVRDDDRLGGVSAYFSTRVRVSRA
ncbi:MAG: molybdopterin-containing oxidoreductase family protein [Planctomycetota bacterium]|jgi:anaerobic selenocysteine-containing dehydrogenase